jgi:hypothetical protein
MKARHFLFGTIFFLSGSISFLTAQDILVTKYASSIKASELSEHLHILASQGFGGRYTGSEGQEMAAEYIRNYFRKNDLDGPVKGAVNPYYQSFTLDKCYWKDQELTHDGTTYAYLDYFLMLGDPAAYDHESTIIYAGYGLDDSAYSDFSNLDVSGRFVMVLSGEPKDSRGNYLLSGTQKQSEKAYYFHKAKTAKKKGAAGLILVAPKNHDYEKYVKGMAAYSNVPKISLPGSEKDTFLTVYTRPDIAASLLDISPSALRKSIKTIRNTKKTTSGQFTGMAHISTKEECYPMNTENVLAYIEGSDKKNEVVVVIAHYDHLGIRKKDGKVYAGADDNASGTAALLEIASAFEQAKKDGIRPQRSVLFIAATAEELGLLGSEYYSLHPVIPMDSTYACVNIDMIGRIGTKYTPDSSYIAGWAYLSKDLFDVAQNSFSIAAPDYHFRMEYRDSARGGSDHYYFARYGIPSIFFFTGIHPDYHEPGDTPDKILYGRMETITRGIFTTVWELANRKENLPVQRKMK